MSTEFKLVKPGAEIPREPPDWSLCILCQKTSSESLTQPWKGRGRGRCEIVGTSYQSFAKNIVKFKEIGKIPLNVCPDQLDDGSGMAETLHKNKARWHKSCRHLFSDSSLERQVKRPLEENDDHGDSPVKPRRSSLQRDVHENVSLCFFCDGEAGSSGLHTASTMGLDKTVRRYATELQDTRLLAKLAPGDMVAQDAKYHKTCLSELYHRYRRLNDSAQHSQQDVDMNVSHQSVALAELISYIDEKRFIETSVPVFRLADLVSIYSERLGELSPLVKPNVNSSRLKERLLLHCPYLKAVTQGRDILLTYDTAIGDAILKACSDDDSEALHLAKAASIIRKQLFNKDQSFTGSLCSGETAPNSLITLVSMILNGPSIKAQMSKNDTFTVAAQTISELITFNSTKTPDNQRYRVRHNSQRELNIPVYIGLKLHVKTRKRELIDRFHSLGLSISYDRVLRISSSIAKSTIEQFESDGVVCPPQLKCDIFTTGQVDNLDHNPSAVTASDSFHGTAHSLCQHPTVAYPGTARNRLILEEISPEKHIGPLPLSYTNIIPVESMPKEIVVPAINGPIRPKTNKSENAKKKDYMWLEKQLDVLEGESDDIKDVTWSAYQAALKETNDNPPTLVALMPLFREAAHSSTTIKHCMMTNRDATHLLNPGQIPVLTMDQPLYAIGKQIQWQFPGLYGEDKYILLLGPLHTEMAMLKAIGEFLDGSGWSNAIVQANVATKGTADSFIHASHVTKSRRAHQVTAACLYILQRKAHSYTMESVENENPLSFTEWCDSMRLTHPMFRYWSLVLDLELTLLSFVRAIRTSDFELYVESMEKLAPWFFALDHVHYSRWLPIHIRDMATLSERQPDAFDHFVHGAFTSNKTGRSFSAIGLDQAHEHVNANVKGDGGAIGLTENPGALRRWMVAGPQVSTIISEFEDILDVKTHDADEYDAYNHHEQTESRQKSFVADVRSLVATIEELGNPFLDNSSDLIRLDSQEIMPKCVVDTVDRIEMLGQKQYETFINERLLAKGKPLSAPITRNCLPLFSNPNKRPPSKDSVKISELKSDCSLFSRLYISSQSRDGNMEEFFKHENQQYPPSISSGGKLRDGKKSDLVGLLESVAPTGVSNSPPVDAKILDGAAIVHLLPLKEARTFGEYAKDVFLPYLLFQVENTQRVDLVWDVYLKNSLKLSTRENRGTGIRRRVSSKVNLPGNWKNFLRNDNNKQELFEFLASQCTPMDTRNVIISTYGNSVVTTKRDLEMNGLQPCAHEEADTRILIHVKDAANSGCHKLMIRTVDTDVVVLAVANFKNICTLEQLWIAFGTGKEFRYIPVHEISGALGPLKANGLPFIHAFTGSYTTSYFANYSKKSAWKTWIAFPQITESFIILSSPISSYPSDDVIKSIERFTTLMYSCTCEEKHVDAARMTLFCKMSRSIDRIPPTKAALVQHIRRATYQAGHVWGQCLDLQPSLPNPTDWGWEASENGYRPLWTTLPVAERACNELISCKCAKTCKGNCKCFRANLCCTLLCKCDGNCYRV